MTSFYIPVQSPIWNVALSTFPFPQIFSFFVFHININDIVIPSWTSVRTSVINKNYLLTWKMGWGVTETRDGERESSFPAVCLVSQRSDGWGWVRWELGVNCIQVFHKVSRGSSCTAFSGTWVDAGPKADCLDLNRYLDLGYGYHKEWPNPQCLSSNSNWGFFLIHDIHLLAHFIVSAWKMFLAL